MAYLGNRFTIGTATEHVRGGKLPGGVSYRFTSPKSAALKEVYCFINWGTEAGRPNTAPKFNISIRPDKNGVPSTTVLDQVNLGGGAWQRDVNIGWLKMVFPNAPLLEAEKVYHIVGYVTEWTDPKFSPGLVFHGLRLGGAFGAPDQPFIIPKTQKIDSALAGAMYDKKFHKAWVPVAHTPIFVLGFADGSFHGQPYLTYRNYDLDFYQSVGQEFTPTKDVTVNAAYVHGRIAWTAPTDKLYCSLFNKTMSSYLARNIVMSTPKIKWWGWCRAGFPSPLTLKAGETIRLEITSPASTRSMSYEIKVISSGEVAPPTPEKLATAFENGAVYSRDGGATWSKEPYFSRGIWDTPYWLS